MLNQLHRTMDGNVGYERFTSCEVEIEIELLRLLSDVVTRWFGKIPFRATAQWAYCYASTISTTIHPF